MAKRPEREIAARAEDVLRSHDKIGPPEWTHEELLEYIRRRDQRMREQWAEDIVSFIYE